MDVSCPFMPGLLQGAYLFLEAAGVIDRSVARRREERDPPVDSGVGLIGVRRADVAGRGQAGNIVPRPRSKSKEDRGQNAQSEPPRRRMSK